MIYLMLIIGIIILAYGLILFKKDEYNKRHEENNNIFGNDDESIEKSVDFSELIEEINSEEINNVKLHFDNEVRYETDEKIHEKLDKMQEILVSISDISYKENKILSMEKELAKRERAVKRNENRIDKLVEAKAKTLAKKSTSSDIKKSTNVKAENSWNSNSANTNLRKTINITNKSFDDKNNVAEKIITLEEQGKSLEEIASELSMGKGEVLLLRNLQKQLKR